jgi:hypothetical protein
MENSAKLNLPYIMPSQAQKHVTHNEAIRTLDALVHLHLLDLGRNDPPDSPAEGQCHGIGEAPTGTFAAHAGKVAAFQEGAWTFHQPKAGWRAWNGANGSLVVFDGADWVPAFDTAAPDMLGINTTADTTNRLAVSSDASLFTHDGAGHQVKINKSTAGSTASLLYQTAWSGRAEMGLAGSDDFSIKVSADGATWKTAMTVDKASGAVALPNTALSAGSSNGVVQFKNGSGFDSDTNFSYDSSTRRLSVGTTTSQGVVNAHTSGGNACIYLSAAGNSPYLQMQNGSIWQGTASGNTQFVTAAGGTFIFTLRPSSGPNNAGLTIINDGRARFGAGGVTSQAKLDIDGAAKVASYTVATAPSASTTGAGSMIFVSDESGGATIAFSDGTNWRRVSDRAVVS